MGTTIIFTCYYRNDRTLRSDLMKDIFESVIFFKTGVSSRTFANRVNRSAIGNLPEHL